VGGVGGFDRGAQLLGLFVAASKIVIQLALMPQVVRQRSVDIGEGKRIEASGDLLSAHSHTPILQQGVQGHTRLSDTDGAGVVDVQRNRIGMQDHGHVNVLSKAPFHVILP
jgi:hypothetical protein